MATFPVLNTLDSGAGSLRQALVDANANAGTDLIVFTGVSGTIALTTGQLAITDHVTITGPGSDILAVSGNNASRIFDIASGKTVGISGLTIRSGNVGTTDAASSWGGAIRTFGSLTVTNCVFSSNAAARGGAIYNEGTLVIDGSTFTANAVNITGGAVENWGSSANTVTISSSTFYSNTATYGGAIGNDNTSGGVVTATNTTVFRNSVGGNGGGLVGSNFVLTNCTISDNSAPDGGGIQVGTLTLNNTIVAGNTAGNGFSDVHIFGTGTGSFNLIGNGTGAVGFTHGVSGNQVGTAGSPINPRLAPLASYGGTTRTMALGIGSPAINAGDTASAPATDQRGVTRVGTADIGAFEAERNYFIVNNTSDNGADSLRQAILDANAAPGADAIAFNIPGTGPHTIAPLSALPTITEAVVIDGTSEPDFAGTPIIEIRGDSAGGGARGLTILATNSTVRGLVINRFSQYGIYISGIGVTGNVIEGNYLGTDVTGTLDLGNSDAGIAIENGAASNLIGGTSPGTGNLISGNNTSGVLLRFGGTNSNLIQGNFIGTTKNGTAALANSQRGILIVDGASNNTIGGTTPGAGNLVSGNVGDGIDILGTTSTGNIVIGNLIGADASGNLDLGNSGLGVGIGGNNNTIGGSTAAARNVISGNNGGGVAIVLGAANNTVTGNYIGTNAAGTAAVGNSVQGIQISGGATGNAIGGTASGAGNVISGNSGDGINISGASHPQGTVSWWKANGNANDSVGANHGTLQGGATFAPGLAGGQAFAFDGVNDYVQISDSPSLDLTNRFTVSFWMKPSHLSGSADYVVSKVNGTGIDNVYSVIWEYTDNTVEFYAGGVFVDGFTGQDPRPGSGIPISDTNWHHIVYTYDGTTWAGYKDGVNIFTVPRSFSLLASAGNLYLGEFNPPSDNFYNGLLDEVAILNRGLSAAEVQAIYSAGGPALGGNTVQGNIIGLNALGAAALANTGDGIEINASAGHLIGGTVAEARNIISGNSSTGVLITGIGASGNVVQGNYIGTDLAGNADRGNTQNGVSMSSGSTYNTVGGSVAGAGNVISGNNARGVVIQGESNLVQGNIVGLNAAGTAALGNSSTGISTVFGGGTSGSNNTIGGTTAAARNVISGNSDSGVGLGGSNNILIGNYIGTNLAGTAAIGNGSGGVNVLSSSGNRIGTNSDGVDDAAERNVIVGSTSQIGVHLDHGSGHTVAGNYIGLAADGSTVLANGEGIRATFSSGNVIGGPAVDARNIVSGNTGVGIHLFGSSNNTVQNNYIGTNAAGTLARGNQDGILAQEFIEGGLNLRPADNNQIIGNLVSGNTRDGISLGATARNNALTGNLVGVNAAGTAALANQATGIFVHAGASQNRIGTDGNGVNDGIEGNVVSGNALSGIAIINGDQTIVAGNKLGTNAAGTAAVANGEHGIFIDGNSQSTRIGTDGNGTGDAAERNIVSGNLISGIDLNGSGVSNTTIAGNYVGTNAAGSAAIGNQGGGGGIYVVNGPVNTLIGGTTPGTGNVISGNSGTNSDGIEVELTGGTRIFGNIIGLDATGSVDLGNKQAGVGLDRAWDTLVGGPTAAHRNIISGNDRVDAGGVWIINAGSAGNFVQGNYIGTDITGTLDRGNTGSGVRVSGGATNSLIGGTGFGEGNLISGNDVDGVQFTDLGVLRNTVSWWRAENNTNDSVDGNTLALVNGATYGAGLGGGSAFDLDGVNDYVNVGDPASGNLDFGAGSFTLDFWVNPRAYGGAMLNKGSHGGLPAGFRSGFFLELEAAGTIRVELSSADSNGLAAQFRTTGTIPLNSWTHLAVVRTATAVTVYFNGMAQAGTVIGAPFSPFSSITNISTSAPLRIGARDNGVIGSLVAFTNVRLDELAAYNRDLSAGEIQAISDLGGLAKGRNVVQGNHIGTNAAGTAALGNTSDGIEINASAGHLIGGTTTAARNIISGNSAGGVTITGAGATANWVAGNYIGTNVTGTLDLGNSNAGVQISGGATSNQIGTNGDGVGDASEGNLLSGNDWEGVRLINAGTNFNIVAGNLIGVNASGTGALGNGPSAGVAILAGAQSNRIGTDGSNDAFNANERNVISGNFREGVYIGDSNTNNNIVAGNFIGTNALGTAVIANVLEGVAIANASKNNRIGTDANGIGDEAERNVISGNLQPGVAIRNTGTTGNTVAGNYIGTDVTGMLDFGNVRQGVRIGGGASSNTIGGSSPAARNVISGNDNHGVSITDSGTNNNVVAGNVIGLAVDGATRLANGVVGVLVTSNARFNRIGTDGNGVGDLAERNIISGNNWQGVEFNSSASNNILAGNYIGLNEAGTAAMANAQNGVWIGGSANSNRIGTDGSNDAFNANERNVISGNVWDGVVMVGSGTANNVVAGNFIGTNASGTAAIGNGRDGVLIVGSATSNRVGTDGNGVADAAERNLISGNLVDGVGIGDAGTNSNIVAGNYVGTNADGTAAVANQSAGVVVLRGAASNRIGTNGSNDAFNAGERNVIAGNAFAGIVIADAGSNANIVAGNYIGTSAAGTAGIQNSHGIIVSNGADDNRIGTDGNGVADADERNVVSGNQFEGIVVIGSTTDRTVIAGNYIGTNAAGTAAVPNSLGIAVRFGAQDTRVGTNGSNDLNNAAERNLISGNNWVGLIIQTPEWNGTLPAGGVQTTRTIVAGNYIGTNVVGSAALPNGGEGILVHLGATQSRIGTDGNGVRDADERNIISGNIYNGVTINGAGTNNHVIAGNYVGLDLTGTVAVPNGRPGNFGDGIEISGGARFNRIGTDGNGIGDMEERNVVSGNEYAGIVFQDSGTQSNIIAGNYVGLDAAGAAAVPNGRPGNFGDGIILLPGAHFNRIGTDANGQADAAERNIVSGNAYAGVHLVGVNSNLIAGNYIGTDVTGTLDLGNAEVGVRVEAGSSNNNIGGALAAARNVIGGNNQHGVLVFGAGSDSNVITGNYVGTTAAGTVAIANSWSGIAVGGGAKNNRLGTDADGANDAGERNIISGNALVGVWIVDAGSDSNVVAGNFIGTDVLGTSPLANGWEGVAIGGGAKFNLIGSNADGVHDAVERNLISGNLMAGVSIGRVFSGPGTDSNIVAGNYIGTDVSGTLDLGNASDGVRVEAGATGNTIGGPAEGARNVISGNNSNGVTITGSGTNNNVISGNYIGTNAAGTAALGNASLGVGILAGTSSNTVGGTNSAARNVISGNVSSGLNIIGAGTSNNVVSGNYVGLDATGAAAVANQGTGIVISGGATLNTIGGSTAGAGNVFSGNVRSGIAITDAGTTQNIVSGNIIGLNAAGTAAVPNASFQQGRAGVLIQSGATANTIGGLTAGERNVISGNASYGVNIQGSGTSGNVLLGNCIGTDVTGTLDLGNAIDGVQIRDGATNNTIGGAAAGARNVISGNVGSGVLITGTGTTSNIVAGNYIGTDVTGTVALANGSVFSDAAVRIFAGAASNTIGGTAAGAGNLISGNVGAGIHVNGGATTGTIIRGNYIGTTASGTAAVGNGYVGVWLEAPDVTIGGGMAGARNVISGNLNAAIFGGGGSSRIQGNYIGTNAAGTAALHSGGQALVQIINGDGLVFGVDGDGINDAGEGNVISGGSADAVTLGTFGAGSMVVAGNLIGLDAAGTTVLGAGRVRAVSSNTTVRIGTNADGISDELERNVFAGRLMLEAGIHHVVAGNYFGTDITGLQGVGGYGILLENVNGVRIGTNADGVRDDVERNIIAGTVGFGILLNANNGMSAANSIAGNYIGLGPDGQTAVPIRGDGGTNYRGAGIQIQWGSQNTIIGGTTPSARNVISGNDGYGIQVWDHPGFPAAHDNTILGNFIGTDASGTVAIGNDLGGILLTAGTYNNTIGGSAAGAGNVISGNAGSGVVISGVGTSNNVVAGNLIGTGPSGNAAMRNAVGVLIDSNSTNNTIGGMSAADRNIISGNAGDGIQIVGASTTGNVVRGNYIGLAFDGLGAISNGGAGVYVSGAPGTIIGGAAPGQGNTIGYNLGAGLRLIDATAAGNETLRNIFRGNLGGAIDLGVTADVTRNDAGDVDGFLNFPVITLADVVGDNFVVAGFARPGVTIDFFLTAPTTGAFAGFGQGGQFVASRVEGSAADLDATTGSYGPLVGGVHVGTDMTNRFRFEIPLVVLPPQVQVGALVTAIALGSTSEFGNARPLGLVVGNGPPGVFAGGDVEIAQGATFEQSGFFLDPDSTSWVATVDYDDGAGPQPLSFAPSEHPDDNPDPDQYPDGATHYDFHLHRDYALPGTYEVVVSVVDNGLLIGTDKVIVTVKNEAPEATFNVFAINNPVVEGEVVTLTGRFTDPGLADTHTIEVDWGDGLPPILALIDPITRTFAATKTYRDDNPSSSAVDQYRIHVSVRDNHGAQTSTPLGLFLEEVRNVLPGNLSFSVLPVAIDENGLVTLTGSFTDPGFLDSHEVAIDWGDGSPATRLALPASGGLLTTIPPTQHRYLDDPHSPQGTFTITVSVTDDDEPLAPVSQSQTATVADVAPHEVTIAAPPAIDEFGVVSIDVAFIDPGTRDLHRVIVDWGDASPAEEFFLERGERSLLDRLHRYRNDASGASSYTITVRVADESRPLAFGTAAATLLVNNLPPVVSPIVLSGPDVVSEGDLVTISGSFTDDGSDDRHTVTVDWGDGSASPALVNAAAGTYTATHRYRDDNPSGTAADTVTIVVTIDDQDDGVTTATTTLTVNNVAPRVQILPGEGSSVEVVNLISLVSDPGIGDGFTYAWTLTSSGTPPTILGASDGPNLSFARNGDLDATYTVSLMVTDDDTGQDTMTLSLALGTPGDDTLTYTSASFPAGITNLLVLGLAGSDVLDATAVPAGLNVILDGGEGTDFLFGGGGDDIFLLRQGDDQANIIDPVVPSVSEGGSGGLSAPIAPVVSTVNALGSDRYYLFPNSTLSVFDDSADLNALDFTFASFGVTYDLSLASGELQDVAPLIEPGEHFIAAEGQFPELVGSSYADKLTGASLSSVYGDDGADLFLVHTGVFEVSFFGGADGDVVLIDPSDTAISDITFQGDDGADVFENSGGVTGLEFFGGSGDDLLVNEAAGTLVEISFQGDDGADVFENSGTTSGAMDFAGGAGIDAVRNVGSLAEITFTGDDGADVFDNSGEVTGTLDFSGGPDADVLINMEFGHIADLTFSGDDGTDIFINDGEVTGNVDFGGGEGDDLIINHALLAVVEITFRGDDGADIFTNDGNVTGTLNFEGGSGNDALINAPLASLTLVDFRGDDGADIFTTSGDVTGSVLFSGGEGNDLITVSEFGSVAEISFNGDDGADVFDNSGTVGTIEFAGAEGNDLLINDSPALVAEIVFSGDDGADVFENDGSVTGGVDFSGGAGNDILHNREGGLVVEIVLSGDDGADVFTNAGDVTGTITFIGGEGDDGLRNVAEGFLNVVVFSGDDGADVFETEGGVGQIDFGGGGDNDLVVIRTLASVDDVVFHGDDGADVFVSDGSVTGVITFAGGGGDDVLVSGPTSASGGVVFSGDAGSDFLFQLGLTASVQFNGGAGSDRLRNEADGVARVAFTGSGLLPADDGADLFVNQGDGVGELWFSGGAGGDVIQNLGNDVLAITFTGDDGADILINGGDATGQIDFSGGAGNDTLTNLGPIADIVFTGDAGVDIFVNRGAAMGQAASLQFLGGADDDAFRNDGTGFDSITFSGADGNDVMQNNADNLPLIQFMGDAGTDVFENNGSGVASLIFTAGDGDDALVNDGLNVGQLTFDAGAGADVLLNTGTGLAGLTFLAGDGNDALEVTSSKLSGNFAFDGGEGDDFLKSSAAELAGLRFLGGPGNDAAWLTPAALRTSSLQFEGGDGHDYFRNEATGLDGVVFLGGPGDDAFDNTGASLTDVQFLGSDGRDQFSNSASGVSGSRFEGGAGADTFYNRGVGFEGVVLGEEGADVFVNDGPGATIEFIGGDGIDAATNNGLAIVELTVWGGAGDDRLLSAGAESLLVVFSGEDGNDLVRNVAAWVAKFHVFGGEGNDAFDQRGDWLGELYFEGHAGADSLILAGDGLDSAIFQGGEGSDTLRIDGKNLSSVQFGGGDSSDSLVVSRGAGSGSQFQFAGDAGDDVFISLGEAALYHFDGGGGADRAVVRGPGSFQLAGGDGDDAYLFSGGFSPLAPALVTIDEAYSGPLDQSRDQLDFSALVGGGLDLDLASTLAQPQSAGGLVVTLTDANGIEDVVGTSAADVIRGNDRDNRIYGAQYAPPMGPLAAPGAAVQWVLLDFDSETLPGEHVYTPDERAAIKARLLAYYQGPDPLAPWLRIAVTESPGDIPAGLDHVTLLFNKTPSFERPGGEANAIDFRNLDLGGTAAIQVNGLLGAGDQPVATSENFIGLAAKIAAHELGHLMGLRHQDAFGPIGFGLSATQRSNQKPGYAGPIAAFETFDHVISSPSSVGSDRFNDLRGLHFGERETIKLAAGQASQADLAAPESPTEHNHWTSAQPIALVGLSVPNAAASGVYAGKQLLVDALAVVGAIGLDTFGHSESDFYAISGRAGQLLNLEVMSQSLTRLGGSAAATIDPVIRVYDAAGVLLPFYNDFAVNDDQLEGTDAALFDLVLPADGLYYIEVDTFRHDIVGPLPDLTGLPDEIRDAFLDTDVGAYELFAFTFATANASDGVDTLSGGLGQDHLDGGPGDSYALSIELGPPAEALTEEPFLRGDIAIVDRGGSNWIATVDYGDGGLIEPLDIHLPSRTIDLAHTYMLPGVYQIVVTVTSDDGQSVTDTLDVTVILANQPPAIDFEGPATSVRGQDRGFVFRAIDPDARDQAGPFVYHIDWGDGSGPEAVSAGATAKIPHVYTTQGIYTVTATVDDPRGLTSPEALGSVSVLRFEVQPDPLVPGATVLVVGGSLGDDTLKVTPGDTPEFLRVNINELEQDIRTKTSIGSKVNRIMMYGQSGSDRLQVDGLAIDAWLYGGEGDDRLIGSRGSDMLLGGGGNDRLDGFDGRDLLVGGLGGDLLHGEGHDDILVAGWTDHDQQLAGLDAILTEWRSARTYDERVLNLRHGGPGPRSNGDYLLNDATAHDDGTHDLLFGETDRDWFLLNLDGNGASEIDLIDDLADGESADDLDL